MFPRLLIILFVINPQLVSLLWPIVMAMMAALYLPAWWIWRRSEVEQIEQSNKQSNPLALQSALFFGMMLAVIILLSHALAEWFGNAGVLILSAFRDYGCRRDFLGARSSEHPNIERNHRRAGYLNCSIGQYHC